MIKLNQKVNQNFQSNNQISNNELKFCNFAIVHENTSDEKYFWYK